MNDTNIQRLSPGIISRVKIKIFILLSYSVIFSVVSRFSSSEALDVFRWCFCHEFDEIQTSSSFVFCCCVSLVQLKQRSQKNQQKKNQCINKKEQTVQKKAEYRTADIFVSFFSPCAPCIMSSPLLPLRPLNEKKSSLVTGRSKLTHFSHFHFTSLVLYSNSLDFHIQFCRND